MSDYPEFTPTTDQVRSAYAYDPEAEYRDPVGFPAMQRENLRAFDRWLAAHDAEVRASVVPEIGMPCANTKPHPAHAWQMSGTGWCLCAGVVTEEPEGRRWFSAAYRAQNGNIIPIGDETVLAEYAQKTVDEFSREDDEGPNYFLASRILSPWVPVKQEGAETDA